MQVYVYLRPQDEIMAKAYVPGDLRKSDPRVTLGRHRKQRDCTRHRPEYGLSPLTGSYLFAALRVARFSDSLRTSQRGCAAPRRTA